MSSQSLRIVLWCPSFQDIHGGIQQFSRLLAAALRKSPHVSSFQMASLGKKSFARGFFLVQALISLLAKPDLVIITHVHLARISVLLRLLKIPYWICAHGIECWHDLRTNDLKSLRHAHQILCVSRFTRSQLERLPVLAGSRFCLFPNHVEAPPPSLTHQKGARQLLQLPEEGPLLLTVSRLSASEHYKGHRELLAILPKLKSKYPSLHYAIAGDGDDLPFLKKQAQENGAGSWVTFLGPLDAEKLELAYAACDAFVMPSTGEGFGIVFLEALVRGKPVLAGNRDGSPDPLLDGALGILVDPQDAQSLCQGLERLLAATPPWNPEQLKSETWRHFGTEALQKRIDALLNHFGEASCAG